jgi:hypothetical protein
MWAWVCVGTGTGHGKMTCRVTLPLPKYRSPFPQMKGEEFATINHPPNHHLFDDNLNPKLSPVLHKWLKNGKNANTTAGPTINFSIGKELVNLLRLATAVVAAQPITPPPVYTALHPYNEYDLECPMILQINCKPGVDMTLNMYVPLLDHQGLGGRCCALLQYKKYKKNTETMSTVCTRTKKLEIPCMYNVSYGILWCYDIEYFVHVIENPIPLRSTVVVLVTTNEMLDLGECLFDGFEIWRIQR